MSCRSVHVNLHYKVLLQAAIEALDAFDLEARRCLVEHRAV